CESSARVSCATPGTGAATGSQTSGSGAGPGTPKASPTVAGVLAESDRSALRTDTAMAGGSTTPGAGAAVEVVRTSQECLSCEPGTGTPRNRRGYRSYRPQRAPVRLRVGSAGGRPDNTTRVREESS